MMTQYLRPYKTGRFRIEDNRRTPRWKQWLMALVGVAAAGCASPAQPVRPVMYVVDPLAAPMDAAGTTHAWPLNARRLPAVALDLQRCADQAAVDQKTMFGSDFRMLRYDMAGLMSQPLNSYVGQQYVASVQDGEGHWYGKREYRKVRFHCLQDQGGRVVYSFIRSE